MGRLKVEKVKLRMEKAEVVVEKAEINVAKRSANRKLYEKARPSEKLFEKAKPSEKLKLNKKGQFAAEQALTPKKALKKKGHLQRNIEKAPVNLVNDEVHHEISKYEEDNVGLKAVHQTEEAVEKSVKFVNYNLKSVQQKNKLRPFKQLEQAENKLAKAEKRLQKKTINYRFEKHKIENSAEYSSSSTLSKWQQKQKIKKAYVNEYRIRKSGNNSTSAKIAKQGVNTVVDRIELMGKAVTKIVTRDPRVTVICLVFLLIFIIISAMFSTGALVSQGVSSSTTVSTYTADDDDLLEVEEHYLSLESALQTEIDNIETTYPDYDEYVYNLVEIGHNPYDLAALLTTLFHAYTLDDVDDKLDEIFALQYNLTTVPSTETRYDSEGNPYTVSILTVTLTNTDIETIANNILTSDELVHYEILEETQGNKPDIFGDYNVTGGAGTSGDLSYSIPSHYLADSEFAALMNEAEKYLGYPYVWGGSSPSTSFDCSGFVCYVLKASGVWDISRTTAQGIFNQTTTIPSSERKAGDIIYFTGTYASAGAVSHVGIYVGDGMMIHCGDPISYASVDSGYWTSYFYAYGRIP